MYLSEETWRKNGVKSRSKINYISTAGNLFPNCQKFADALKPIAQNKGINVTYKTLLTEVDGENRVATFKNLDTGDLTK
jgi:sulfide:quinone oxidoreductase